MSQYDCILCHRPITQGKEAFIENDQYTFTFHKQCLATAQAKQKEIENN